MRLVDSEPEIDADSDEGKTIVKAEGHLELRDVHFRYREFHTEQPEEYLFICSVLATRPNVRVLRGISLTVPPGSYVAIVGASGCGYVESLVLLCLGTPDLFGTGKVRCRCDAYGSSKYRSIRDALIRNSIQLVERFYDPQAGQIFVRIFSSS